jgi:hypothetical protein
VATSRRDQLFGTDQTNFPHGNWFVLYALESLESAFLEASPGSCYNEMLQLQLQATAAIGAELFMTFIP